jgi:hypothetical protein
VLDLERHVVEGGMAAVAFGEIAQDDRGQTLLTSP